uniref:Uncharacterized protein n=1 Tax=viral metagenome TaxID=1070528 RepID=A0A6C0CV81_9ZZZZ
MFTSLYLQTTNPKLLFRDLFSKNIFTNIILSVFFHTAVYVVFFNLASYIFFGKSLTNICNFRLTVSLLLIMFFGFFARFAHVKEIYHAYGNNMEKTREHLDKLYIGWIFLS